MSITDQGRAAEDARIANLHRNLEGDICDLRNLTFVCRTLIEETIKPQEADPSNPTFKRIMLNQDHMDGLMFLVGEVETRARRFQVEYYNGLEEVR